MRVVSVCDFYNQLGVHVQVHAFFTLEDGGSMEQPLYLPPSAVHMAWRYLKCNTAQTTILQNEKALQAMK